VELYVVDVNGTNLTRLTDNYPCRWSLAPSWSPDDRLAFNSGDIEDCGTAEDYLGPGDVYIRDFTAGVVTKERDDFPCCFDWSPDANKIAFAATDPIGPDYYTVAIANRDGSEEKQLYSETKNCIPDPLTARRSRSSRARKRTPRLASTSTRSTPTALA
jgi:Tol biopolymer transport system component